MVPLSNLTAGLTNNRSDFIQGMQHAEQSRQRFPDNKIQISQQHIHTTQAFFNNTQMQALTALTFCLLKNK